MIIALSLVIVGLLTVLLISHQVERAPEGFEDGRGFHLLSPKQPPITSAASIGATGELIR